ncbi:MAG: class I SAM-dependent RNA methyltransferase [Lachnospiraceae bacterium]|nr:class I SAM-dependent RNA methyltransferase [Lachnospiraceae bacterium]
MDKLTFVLVCHFGLEKVLKSEVRKLGLEIVEVTDGEIKASGNLYDIPRLNFNLRTCERVLIELSAFKAVEPNELFENAKLCEIERFVPADGMFIIAKASQDRNSKFKSSMINQKTVKKAFSERLKKVYKTDFLPEEKGKYPFRIKYNKTIWSIRLDTTGDSLHKRGYRIKSGLAPIEETLASALIKLTDFNSDTVLIDPFCGSGTIPIETAMIASNIPPSLDRAFISETWDVIPKDAWKKARNEALENIRQDRLSMKNIKIFGFDIDENMIRIARENAKRADVEQLIHFEKCSVKDFWNLPCIKEIDSGIILTNPPYGERLEDKEKIIPIYKDLKKSYDYLKENKQSFNMHVITSYDNMAKIFGKESKNRKIYNGMIKTYLYSYLNI